MYYENKEVKAFLLLTTSDTAKRNACFIDSARKTDTQML